MMDMYNDMDMNDDGYGTDLFDYRRWRATFCSRLRSRDCRKMRENTKNYKQMREKYIHAKYGNLKIPGFLFKQHPSINFFPWATTTVVGFFLLIESIFITNWLRLFCVNLKQIKINYKIAIRLV